MGTVLQIRPQNPRPRVTALAGSVNQGHIPQKVVDLGWTSNEQIVIHFVWGLYL